MLFGAHVSVAGGLQNAVAKGQLIGADVLQIFVSPPQSFKTTAYSDEQIGEFKRLYQSAGFSGLFLHAIYLINLASENSDLVELSKKSLIHYLQMGDRLGAVGTIVHLGSYKDGNLELLKTQVVEAIKEILTETPFTQKLIVENCAGKKIVKNLDELVEIYERVGSDRLSFCIDTQHLFASGIDVGNQGDFTDWLAEFDRRIGIDRLACVHANDSKSDLGSGLDRHENIGEGEIGEAGFRSILRQPLLEGKSFILETPGENRSGPDMDNMNRLRGLME